MYKWWLAHDCLWCFLTAHTPHITWDLESTVEGVRIIGGVDHLTSPPATADSQEKKPKKLRGCRVVEKVTVRWEWNRNGEEKRENRGSGGSVWYLVLFFSPWGLHVSWDQDIFELCYCLMWQTWTLAGKRSGTCCVMRVRHIGALK